MSDLSLKEQLEALNKEDELHRQKQEQKRFSLMVPIKSSIIASITNIQQTVNQAQAAGLENILDDIDIAKAFSFLGYSKSDSKPKVVKKRVAKFDLDKIKEYLDDGPKLKSAFAKEFIISPQVVVDWCNMANRLKGIAKIGGVKRKETIELIK